MHANFELIAPAPTIRKMMMMTTTLVRWRNTTNGILRFFHSTFNLNSFKENSSTTEFSPKFPKQLFHVKCDRARVYVIYHLLTYVETTTRHNRDMRSETAADKARNNGKLICSKLIDDFCFCQIRSSISTNNCRRRNRKNLKSFPFFIVDCWHNLTSLLLMSSPSCSCVSSFVR